LHVHQAANDKRVAAKTASGSEHRRKNENGGETRMAGAESGRKQKTGATAGTNIG
jgi:hypothetical protein